MATATTVLSFIAFQDVEMSTLYISEFSNLPFVSNGVIQAAAAHEWVADQTVAIGASSTPSNSFNIETNYVILSADVVCSISWTMAGAGSVAAATTSNLRLAAGEKIMFGVAPGMKLSAISNT
jgi:hypothetical protein